MARKEFGSAKTSRVLQLQETGIISVLKSVAAPRLVKTEKTSVSL
jgi:hypothetical protein